MNIYDKTHELAKALNQSIEYQSFLKAKRLIDGDDTTKKIIKDFMMKKLEIQYEVMSGKEQDKVKVEQLQKMYELIALNPKARDFLDAQMRFERVMTDIYKIIGESVAEGMDFFVKE